MAAPFAGSSAETEKAIPAKAIRIQITDNRSLQYVFMSFLLKTIAHNEHIHYSASFFQASGNPIV